MPNKTPPLPAWVLMFHQDVAESCAEIFPEVPQAIRDILTTQFTATLLELSLELEGSPTSSLIRS